MITFNIGSAIDGQDKALSISRVIMMLDAHGLEPFQFRTDLSETETTYIVCVRRGKFNRAALRRVVHDFCLRWGQDAIAYLNTPEHPDEVYWGELVGPKAEEWGGKFDASKFIAWDK